MSFRSKPPSSSSSSYTNNRNPNRNPNPGLCAACSKINISQALQNAYSLYEGARHGTNTRSLDVYRSPTGPPYLGHFYHVATLGTRLSTLSTPSCRLCTFLLQTYPSARTPSPLGHKLLALCTSESYLFQTPQKSANHRKKDRRPWGLIDHNVFLAVVPIIAEIPSTGLPLRWMETELPLHGGIYRLSEWDRNERTRIAVPRLLGEKADLKLAGLWLGCCREAHVGCAARKSGPAEGKGKGKVELRGFRAIDCEAKPPVVVSRPWSEPYVVLSYVWGPPSGDWPPTVLDAVEVTRRMGERWLWVDRLCIDQGNAEEKAWLISKMGEIYEGAEFTIVGAAGDARTGLLGVSGAKREVQPGIPGSTLLVSTLPDPRTTIRSSEWATRGWTYQEGVLSNRRLVFTSSQIYWECNGMAVHESLDLLDLYDPTETRFADYMLAGIFDGDIHRVPELQYGYQKYAIEDEDVEVQVRKLDAHISAFTARQLSFDSDALNAFLGVAGRYEREGDGGLGLLLGMPVWRGKFATGKGGLRDTFALSLTGWVHGGRRMVGEGEVYAVESVRGAEFPSWTWVGWKGRAAFITTVRTGQPGNEGDLKEDNIHVKFFKAMTSNSWARGIGFRVWSAFMTVHTSDGSEVIRVVDQGTVLAIDQSKKWLLTIRSPFVLQQRALMSKDVQIHLSVRMNMAELKAGHAKGELINVLVFASTVPFVFNGKVKFLVLRRLDEAMRRWERIGLLVMTVEEHEWNSWKNTKGMVKALPVERFRTDVVLA
ncbi:Heterokaryon incompatibility protein [Rutstroemia sp. NJR-2017a BBW]|nr:Heterokaryon incompatibility protein [Rutstroemia sp. NJR-2017a BBW]